jgi:hypothetical protein
MHLRQLSQGSHLSRIVDRTSNPSLFSLSLSLALSVCPKLTTVLTGQSPFTYRWIRVRSPNSREGWRGAARPWRIQMSPLLPSGDAARAPQNLGLCVFLASACHSQLTSYWHRHLFIFWFEWAIQYPRSTITLVLAAGDLKGGV